MCPSTFHRINHKEVYDGFDYLFHNKQEIETKFSTYKFNSCIGINGSRLIPKELEKLNPRFYSICDDRISLDFSERGFSYSVSLLYLPDFKKPDLLLNRQCYPIPEHLWICKSQISDS